ncbi:unnamed protein product [Mytilus coruscus]|uniref:Uncharacterized protein n=1 Tax=Mytilus coruscus TaxID=42192 RepID=A0A6J8E1G2_MYTCO|nr:unnamed protein product [Mytilus coruscus]
MKSALINACLSGKEENVEWLLENIDQSQFDIQTSVTETFVNRNVTNVVKTLLNYSDSSSLNMNTVVVEACAIGNMTLVKWLLENNDRNLVDINQALYSVLNVHSKIIENHNVYKKSVTREKRSLVMWVLEKFSLSLFDMNNTVKEICRNGWTEILQWIWGNAQDHSFEMGPAINVACVHGHKELVEWALSNIDAKYLDTETLMNECYGDGLLTVAKWMWENIEHSKLDMRTAMNDACVFVESKQYNGF